MPSASAAVCDLPAGVKRLRQKADGMRATIVNGQVLLRDNEPTGNLSGKLVRRGARH
jgi:N-acyl-D-amino-acid deacylase